MYHTVAGVDNIITTWEPLSANLRTNVKERVTAQIQAATHHFDIEQSKRPSLSVWTWSCQSSQWQVWSIYSTEKIAEDTILHDDLSKIVTENAWVMADSLSFGIFACIFRGSQMKAATLKNAWQMRWAPIMAWWCFCLCHLSSNAYETPQDTGTIKLPSQWSFNQDYTHHTKATAGFSREVDKQLHYNNAQDALAWSCCAWQA